ncbi:MAG: phosphoribosylaminoimidazolesuccinocarboxamide synthase [bacterium]|nr:phosphoribosylaminoimidazolesuccinocarboxamide synthase [bacterium]
MVLETNLKGIPLISRGKVRDIYDLGSELLIVATDRISAFDFILPTGIPDKGKVLTELSKFWFELTKDIIPNHLISTDVDEFPSNLREYKSILEGRSMLVKKTSVVPVECVVRGWLAGSGWEEYQKSGTVCGIQLPKGLVESSKLLTAIFTPTTKATEGHDMPINFEQCRKLVGDEVADSLRRKSIALYTFAAEYARKKGIIIADTKFEFGILNNQIILIDEVFTPDSSRFWSVSDYVEGESQKSFDKQFVRDYLLSIKWNKQPPVPELPDEIVKKTMEKYMDAVRLITTGEKEKPLYEKGKYFVS